MKNHTKIYLREMGYDDSDFIPCEISGLKAVDIHHIRGRGRGGRDTLCNLMAVTRREHERYGDKKDWHDYLIRCHFGAIWKRINDEGLDPFPHIHEAALSGCKESKEFVKRYPKMFTELWFSMVVN